MWICLSFELSDVFDGCFLELFSYISIEFNPEEVVNPPMLQGSFKFYIPRQYVNFFYQSNFFSFSNEEWRHSRLASKASFWKLAVCCDEIHRWQFFRKEDNDSMAIWSQRHTSTISITDTFRLSPIFQN